MKERLTTCKGCIHLPVCETYNDYFGGHRCECYKSTDDVVEVVLARWEKIHDDSRVNKYRCTNCKSEKMRDNYCPNCGAKMDGVTDNNVGDKIKEMTGGHNGN